MLLTADFKARPLPKSDDSKYIATIRLKIRIYDSQGEEMGTVGKKILKFRI